MASLRPAAVSAQIVVLFSAVLLSACSHEATPLLATAEKAGESKSADTGSVIAVSGSETNQSAKSVVETAVQTSEIPLAQLSADQLVVETDQPMMLTFTVSNDSGQTHRLLTWASPLEEEITGVMFRVARLVGGEAQEIPFAGLMVRRGPPPDEAFVDLAPGEKITNSVSLDTSYDVVSSGQYLIEFSPLTTTDNDSFMMGETEVGFGNRKITITRR